MDKYGREVAPRQRYDVLPPKPIAMIDGRYVCYPYRGKPRKFRNLDHAIAFQKRIVATWPTKPVWQDDKHNARYGRPLHTITWHAERHAFSSGRAIIPHK